MVKFHAKNASALGCRAQLCSVTKHFSQGYHAANRLSITSAHFHSENTSSAAINLANNFSQDATLRAAVVAAAEQRVNAQTSVPDESLEVAELQAEMAALKLPIGWSTLPDGFTGWLSMIGGLAITTLAVSLGAPFWFDILSKIMNVRATGKPEQTNNGSKEANGALVNIALD